MSTPFDNSVLGAARRDRERAYNRAQAGLSLLAEGVEALARRMRVDGAAEDEHDELGQKMTHVLGLLTRLAQAQRAVEVAELRWAE